jgi:hypothetical protein
MENLHPTEIRVLEVVRDGKDWRTMRHARNALLKRFPGVSTVRDYPEPFKDRDDLVGKVLRKVWHDDNRGGGAVRNLPPTFHYERYPVQMLFAKEAERRAREKEREDAREEEAYRRAQERRKEREEEINAQDCWHRLKEQGFSVPDIDAFKVLYKLSVVEGKVRPEFYDCDREEMVWFNPTD